MSEEVKALIDEQGKLVKRFRDEVVDKISTSEEKAKTFINEKDEKMQAKLDELEERINKATAPSGVSSKEDSLDDAEAKELTDLYDNYIRKGHSKFDRESADRMKELATKQYSKILGTKTAGDPVTSGTPGTGGHLIPEAVYRQILNQFQEVDPMRNEAEVVEITSNKIEFHTGFDAAAGWEAEAFTYAAGSAPDAADPSISQKQISCNVLAGQVRLSQEALEDIPNIGQYVTQRLATKMAYAEGNSFIDGSGSGQPEGIALAANLVLMEAQGNEKEMGSKTEFDFDEFFDLQAAIKTGYQNSAKWFFNLNTLAALRKVQDTQGNYLWQGALGGAEEGHPATVAGRPYAILQSLPNLGGSNNPVFFGDMKQAYKIIQRIGVSVKRLDEFQYPDVLFIARTRIGGGLVLPEALGYLKCASS